MNFIEQEKKQNSIADAANLFASSLKNGGKIISCGNGGSSCDVFRKHNTLVSSEPEVSALRNVAATSFDTRESRC